MEKPIHCYKNEFSSGEKNTLNCSVPLLDGRGPCCYCGGGRLQNFISPFFFRPSIKTEIHQFLSSVIFSF